MFFIGFEPGAVVEKIKLALEFGKKHGQTTGRERIIGLGLYSETVARKIIKVYKSVLSISD